MTKILIFQTNSPLSNAYFLACFEFEVDSEVRKADKVCEWGMQYKSVVGFGQASFLEDSESKRRPLDNIMTQYSGESSSYPETKLKQTVIIKADVEQMTGKQAQ